MGRSTAAELQSTIESLEHTRGQALINEDWTTLERLIAPQLVHIHANGHAEDRAGYFEGLRNRLSFQRVERESLNVQGFDHVAVATGILRQTLTVRQTGEIHNLRVMTTQVWVAGPAGWQQTSFHATHLRD